jgi:hypothetical protein
MAIRSIWAPVMVVAALAITSGATAAPITLFDGVVSTDNATPAPSGADAALAGPFGLVGGLTFGPVSVTAPQFGVLTVTATDLAAPGDVFEVFANGVSLGITSPVSADPAGPNSTGTFTTQVSPGAVTIDAWDVIMSYVDPNGFTTSPYGGQLDPTFGAADLSLTVTFDVPEPAAGCLLALGAIALAATSRSRRAL